MSIGDLAKYAGVSPATLRMWEERHGFPVPRRLASGHRRYTDDDAATVRRVVQLRDSGVRLDLAIAEAHTHSRPRTRSVFSELRRSHSHLSVLQLRKATLMGITRAIEDEIALRGSGAHLFGAFQEQTYFQRAADRWGDLAQVADTAWVFANFQPDSASTTSTSKLIKVALPPEAPMRREWAVVCDAPGLAIALTAWELPGQHLRIDSDRIFEAMWTLDARAVRDAARACAAIAADVEPVAGKAPLRDLAMSPVADDLDLAAVTLMFNRVISYIDQFGDRGPERT